MRNRKQRKYKGPLVIFEKHAKCFRNIPGLDLCSIDRLNVLKLAPGGHVGRFCIWTYGSFLKLNSLFSVSKDMVEGKLKNLIPSPLLNRFSISRIINSNEVQNSLKPLSGSFRKSKKNSNLKKK